MATRRKAGGKKLVGDVVLKLELKAIKHHATATIALLKKAKSVEGGKQAVIRRLERVVKEMRAVCPIMGLKVGF